MADDIIRHTGRAVPDPLLRKAARVAAKAWSNEYCQCGCGYKFDESHYLKHYKNYIRNYKEQLIK